MASVDTINDILGILASCNDKKFPNLLHLLRFLFWYVYNMHETIINIKNIESVGL